MKYQIPSLTTWHIDGDYYVRAIEVEMLIKALAERMQEAGLSFEQALKLLEARPKERV